ncbi:hypothetical protein PINS_up006776 [Pythium insidiosum]|nr:hypothetical protein PINS_up006776 [Pythium insidiosum]
MEQQQQRAASLLALIASNAMASSGAVKSDEELAAEEEQRRQTIMYEARMKYLRDDDHVKPDMLFMTRKQAQKLAKQDTIKMSLKKIETAAAAPPAGNGGAAAGAGNSGTGAAGAGVIGKRSRFHLDDKQQTWVAVTQAGCHFWQSQETGECRSKPPPGWEGRPHPGLMSRSDSSACRGAGSDSEKEEDIPFPPAFAFLNDGRARQR